MVKPLRAVITALTALAVVATACTPGPGPGAQMDDFEFQANRVEVVSHNDSFVYGTRDEVYQYNIAFRVKVGVPGSADAFLAGNRNLAFNDLGDGEEHFYGGAEQATAVFEDVSTPDVADLATPGRLEIVGVWSWAMDRDDVAVTGVVNESISVVENTLEQFVASGTVPSNPDDIVDQLLGDFGDIVGFAASALFSSVPGIPDDPIGSRFYVGVGSRGTLAGVIDAASTTVPGIEIPIVTVPPDIGGITIFSTGGNRQFLDQVFDQGQGRHLVDLSFSDFNNPPVAAFTPSVTSGAGSLTVDFDASASSDPDGTIVSYNWEFADFTTGAGQNVSHTFGVGTYPVRLTVTDEDGKSSSAVQTITVTGTPPAPTNLQKVGAGCCNTYGDFAWNEVPGAEEYRIEMDAFFGGGCLSDHGATIAAPAASGRVQAFGLCLGSQYDVRIRVKAAGTWSAWSPDLRITL